MLSRLFVNAVRQGVVSTPRRTMGASPIAPHPVEEQFYVAPRVNGELPLPGSYTISPRVLVTHLVTITSVIALWALNRETRTIPIELEKVSITNPQSGALESFFKPVGVWSRQIGTERVYPGFEVVVAPSPDRAPKREGEVVVAMEVYNQQMDKWAAGDTSFIGTPGQIFFPNKANVLPSLELPQAQRDLIAASKQA
jgi:hypothetical protein